MARSAVLAAVADAPGPRGRGRARTRRRYLAASEGLGERGHDNITGGFLITGGGASEGEDAWESRRRSAALCVLRWGRRSSVVRSLALPSLGSAHRHASRSCPLFEAYQTAGDIVTTRRFRAGSDSGSSAKSPAADWRRAAVWYVFCCCYSSSPTSSTSGSPGRRTATALQHVAEPAHAEDVGVLAAGVVELAPEVGDVDLHQVLGVALAVVVLVHGGEERTRVDDASGLLRQHGEEAELGRRQGDEFALERAPGTSRSRGRDRGSESVLLARSRSPGWVRRRSARTRARKTGGVDAGHDGVVGAGIKRAGSGRPLAASPPSAAASLTALGDPAGLDGRRPALVVATTTRLALSSRTLSKSSLRSPQALTCEA